MNVMMNLKREVMNVMMNFMMNLKREVMNFRLNMIYWKINWKMFKKKIEK